MAIGKSLPTIGRTVGRIFDSEHSGGTPYDAAQSCCFYVGPSLAQRIRNI
jgi:hypothetical protein